jgi:hypothetical protein
MGCSIDFDDQACIDAQEIDDVIPNRNLAPKFETRQAPVTQGTPQQTFSICLLLP